MNYFPGITPDERYKNELLNELRRLNANIEKSMKPSVTTIKPQTTAKKTRQKRTS